MSGQSRVITGRQRLPQARGTAQQRVVGGLYKELGGYEVVSEGNSRRLKGEIPGQLKVLSFSPEP